MSSLAAPRSTAPRGALTGAPDSPSRRPPPGVLIAGGLAAALILTAFVWRGGLQLGPTTWTEVGLTVAGAALAVYALLRAPGPAHGTAAVAAFGLLAALTALSISWSIRPDDSWLEANRTISYLAVFGAGVALARLAPDRGGAVVTGVLIAVFTVVAYDLLAKLFPAALAHDELSPRLRAVFGYWNADGLEAALGVPACLWLGTRRRGHAALNALAFPFMGLLVLALLLSYSRGSLLAAAIGAAVWFALVPRRLRGAAVLAAGAVGGGLLALWYYGQDGLKFKAPLPLRVDAGHQLGLLILLMVAVLLVAGLVVGFGADRRPLSPRVRRRAGTTLIAALVLVPVIALGVLAATPSGLSGHFNSAWKQLTDTHARVSGSDPSRLTALGSVRARYWDEAFKVFDEHPWRGDGAGAYATARLRYANAHLIVRNAHGYVPQTLADLGLIGLAASLALLVAWGLAARTTLRRAPPNSHRAAAATLFATAIVFGVHSTIDWTWFVPGNAALGLVCAGWVAGRGPLGAERAQSPGWPPSATRAFLAAAIGLAALAGVFATVQPLRADDAQNTALAALDHGDVAAAIAAAEKAQERNPESTDPLLLLGDIYDGRGAVRNARAQYEAAVRLQPANPDAWSALAEFELRRGNLDRAQAALAAGLYLDPGSVDLNADAAQLANARYGKASS